MQKLKRYYSKVLLFGEYAVIHGSSALAIPLHSHFGQFESKPSAYDLDEFYDELRRLEFDEISFNLDLFEEDQKKGVAFHSNIPIGYGMGSSGVLSAAVFDRYFRKRQDLSLEELRSALAKIESYFHGSSSGMDPLVSFLNASIYKHSDGTLEIFESKPNVQFYLIDSGIPRVTSTLVELYLEKYQDLAFAKAIESLCLLNENAIQSFDIPNEQLLQNFKEISILQQEYFPEMIPENILALFNELPLKLCGAGGGGFYLGACKMEEFPSIKQNFGAIPLL